MFVLSKNTDVFQPSLDPKRSFVKNGYNSDLVNVSTVTLQRSLYQCASLCVWEENINRQGRERERKRGAQLDTKSPLISACLL